MNDWRTFFRISPAFDRGVLHVRPRGRSGGGKVLRFVQESGRKRADVLSTSSAGMLISPRVAAVLEGRSGFAPVAARIVLRDGAVDESYVALDVAGRSGPVDRALSEPTTLPAMTPAGQPSPGLRGLRFDPSTWDGSEVFRPAETELTFVTAPVAEALVAAGLSNLLVEPIDEIQFADV
ncbi:MAG TPA: hypothetical protein VF529_22955 [Solirubrobacteraceae bacterium]